MSFSQSSRAASRLVELPRAASTNDELASRAKDASDWPEFSVVVTEEQTAGRGRLGRTWSAPAGTMVAISVLLRPVSAGIHAPDALGWIPLIAGVAMTRALVSLGADAELKWPNDVLIGGRKVCGILAEAVAPDAVVVGSGVNVGIPADQLPVPTATSLGIEGVETDADTVLAGYLRELRSFYGAFAEHAGDAADSGVRSAVVSTCSTIGKDVRVELPGGKELLGVAQGLDDAGRLVVASDGGLTAVAAGDVTHLRY
ncbi:biotin--[acetyl-CoA-carboxylase] ligase [Humibacter albus]|uniref:biotin--[acetyl-CoA-carboxylase] ligase n=1 Tax=Humibacter albus TaxID=427754 RepID=UPI0003B53ECF|nr:biotin--[acetyl-CoA-carboxylase] ligase [Humibacter albus]